MAVHQRAVRATISCLSTTASRRKINTLSAATRSQASGKARLNALAKSLPAESLSDEALPETPSTSSNMSTPSEAGLIVHDIASVQDELSRWKSLDPVTR